MRRNFQRERLRIEGEKPNFKLLDWDSSTFFSFFFVGTRTCIQIGIVVLPTDNLPSDAKNRLVLTILRVKVRRLLR
jgi:hypothetical protein